MSFLFFRERTRRAKRYGVLHRVARLPERGLEPSGAPPPPQFTVRQSEPPGSLNHSFPVGITPNLPNVYYLGTYLGTYLPIQAV